MSVAPLKKNTSILMPRCRIASGFFSRFLGLMGRKQISPDEGLLFPRCNSIHTFFMRIPIDVVLINARGEVIDVVVSMRPWRLLAPRKGITAILELRAGRSEELGICSGDILQCGDVWS